MTTDSLLTLKLPEGYAFADLKLRRYAADEIDLDMDLFKLVCTLNGIDFAPAEHIDYPQSRSGQAAQATLRYRLEPA